jgi:hypothetical protein
VLNGKRVQHAAWNTLGAELFIVLENDVYWVKASKAMTPEALTRLTFDGRPSAVYNGIPDYLYSSMKFNKIVLHNLVFMNANIVQSNLKNHTYLCK